MPETALPATLDHRNHVRGLLWHHLAAAWSPRLGADAWAAVVRDAGAGDADQGDPFTLHPLGPLHRALDLLDARHGAGDGAAVRATGRDVALAWAGAYRHLARRLRGDPARMLEVFAGEVAPWLLGRDPAPAVEAGPASALVALPPGLPPPFEAGLLEGLAEAAGAPGARVVRAAGGDRWAVSWERSLPRPPAAPAAVALAALRAVRPPLLAAGLVPVVVGAALAWADGFHDPVYLALTLLGVACFQAAAYAANDYFDHRSRADDANATPTRFAGGSRVIQRGLLTPRAVLALAVALWAAGIAAGLHVAFHLQWERGAGLAEVAGLGLAGFLLGVLYTAPPVRLAHRGLGELAVGLGFGPLILAGTYLVQRTAAGGGAAVTLDAALAGIPVGALVAAVLYVNEFPDRPWDAGAGKRTLVVRLGARAVQGYAVLLAVAYAGIAALALRSGAWPLLLALATLPLAVHSWRLLRRHHAEPFRLAGASAAALALHLGTGLLLACGLVLARLLHGGV